MQRKFVSQDQVVKTCGKCKFVDQSGKNSKYPYCTNYSNKCFSVLNFCQDQADKDMEKTINAAYRADQRYETEW